MVPPTADCFVRSPILIPSSVLHTSESQDLIAPTLNLALASASAMAPQDQGRLYTIDYSTEEPQLDSKLCTIPDELKVKIGEYVLDGFGLEFRYGVLSCLNTGIETVD